MNLRPAAAFLAMAVCVLHSAGAFAQAPVVDARELDERLKRLERLFGSESLFKLFDEVESLGTEVRELRGQMESAVAHGSTSWRSASESSISTSTSGFSASKPPRRRRPPARRNSRAHRPRLRPLHRRRRRHPRRPAATSAPDPTGDACDHADARSTGGVDPFAEQQAYQSAFDLLKSGRYEDAAVAFQQFIAEFPAGTYADNAQYWLGETFYITRRFDRGGAGVRAARLDAPEQPEAHPCTAEDRILPRRARKRGRKPSGCLGELIERHPQSAAAGLARKRLADHPPITDTSGRVGAEQIPDGAATPGNVGLDVHG